MRAAASAAAPPPAADQSAVSALSACAARGAAPDQVAHLRRGRQRSAGRKLAERREPGGSGERRSPCRSAAAPRPRSRRSPAPAPCAATARPRPQAPRCALADRSRERRRRNPATGAAPAPPRPSRPGRSPPAAAWRGSSRGRSPRPRSRPTTVASCRLPSSASASPARSSTASTRMRPSAPVRASISSARSPWRRCSSSATASSGARMRGPRACSIACMRSIMAARPDGILSVARSPSPSSTPSASACLLPSRCRIWCSIESSHTRLTTVTERVWFLRQARAMRCSSLAGFHGRSTFTTALADLQVQADAAAVGGEEQPAGRVLLEAVDLGAAALLRHRAGVPGRLHPHLGGELAHQLEHALPLREHDDLAVGLLQQIAEDAFQLLELGADAAGGIEDRRRVADHAHAGEQHHQLVELGRQQRPLLRLRDERAAGLLGVLLVAQPLLLDHRHEVVLDRAAGQLGLDVGLAAAEHHRLRGARAARRGSCSRPAGRARRARRSRG